MNIDNMSLSGASSTCSDNECPYISSEEESVSLVYDVCIVGAGPHALSVLSALHSPDSALTEAQRLVRRPKGSRRGTKLSVCVVDPSGEWLSTWNKNFTDLEIEWLRSPLLAHPDANDVAALLEYAEKHRRWDEIRQVDFSCPCLTATSDHVVGLYNLPSSSLFNDFCMHLSAKLPHDFIKGKVEAVDRPSDGGSVYSITASGDQRLQARHMVFALGAAGGPRIPTPFSITFDGPGGQSVLHSTQCHRLKDITPEDIVLVVGGGLSAAQAALVAVSAGAKETILCSRRPLTTRQFDVPLDWVNPRRNRGCRYEFFNLPDEKKPEWAYKVRGGGSIPKDYMDRLKNAEAAGKLKLMVDEVKRCDRCTDPNNEVCKGHLCVQLGETTLRITRVVLATGSNMQGVSNPLLSALVDKFSLPVSGGFPVLSDGLKWGSENFFVTGSLALLQLGPDASNLMGARRAAQMCATELGTFDKLYHQGAVYSNKYNALEVIDPEFF